MKSLDDIADEVGMCCTILSDGSREIDRREFGRIVQSIREEVREECARLVELPSDFPAIMDMDGLDVLAAAIRAMDLK